MSSPLCRKKRSSPRSDEKVARPRRRLAVGTDKRRDGGKRHQKDGYDEIAAVAECEVSVQASNPSKSTITLGSCECECEANFDVTAL